VPTATGAGRPGISPIEVEDHKQLHLAILPSLPVRSRQSLRLLMLTEIAVNVPVSFKDIHDFEAVCEIAKEDHIALIGNAADIGAKLRTCATNRAGQRCQFMALRAKPLHKILGNGNAAARIGDIGQNLKQVGLNRGK
jgi:hypothetical protein